ncbi:MAG: DUF1611 domain-containing protein, partial [Acidobacteriota bacterium]|nr:DUF1611 domain-containing protein [Acidobacteriota bacterium]
MDIPSPYVLFLGDEESAVMAKTARGLAYWRPEQCVGQVRVGDRGADLGLPEMTIAEATRSPARTLVVGVANIGGFIPDSWVAPIVEALEGGLDVASGLHTRLSDIEAIRSSADRVGRRLYDVRHPERDFPVGSGQSRSGERILTVGTDCAVGKMYTVLALEREMRSRGLDADFRATG